jgi:hypothetical protein
LTSGSLGRVFWTRVERNGRTRRNLVDDVDHAFKQGETLGRKPQSSADHHAVVACAQQLLFEHGLCCFIRRDHARVTLPSPLFDLCKGHGNAGVDLLRVKARRQSGVGEVYGFRLLADESETDHSLSPRGPASAGRYQRSPGAGALKAKTPNASAQALRSNMKSFSASPPKGASEMTTPTSATRSSTERHARVVRRGRHAFQ